ncbi:hypothetical protein niasHT_023213 [Heterodera trifolii]|uniref:Uncharacterized protein n=1 Tax=Heterodera trifolii TaxID=157864 RepID=A0ABD2JDD5_9BILA
MRVLPLLFSALLLLSVGLCFAQFDQSPSAALNHLRAKRGYKPWKKQSFSSSSSEMYKRRRPSGNGHYRDYNGYGGNGYYRRKPGILERALGKITRSY